MIGRLRGILLEKQPPRLLIDVRGVGYEVEAPMSTFYELPAQGEPITLRIHLAVKEDGHTLYGFHTEQERALFRSLIRVSGVGPKMALAFLSGMRTEEFLRCVRRRDTAALIRLPGVGKKTAERLVIEMQDRLSAFEIQAGTAAGAIPCATGGTSETFTEALSALLALGYKTPEAQRLLAGLAEAELSSEELIRLALRKAVHKP
ncbi:MAG: Holliday junction branch migration protein RuvA [Nitrococcus mobilis]|nr:Holliday junction branch migration protein RuvA [Nitrococcus mobilis]